MTNELRAAAWYTVRGCEVFFPMMKHGPVDFIASTEEGLLRIQVKTATMCARAYLQVRTRSGNNETTGDLAALYDVLFVVYGDEFWEIPAEDITAQNIVLRGPNLRPRGRRTNWDSYRVQ